MSQVGLFDLLRPLVELVEVLPWKLLEVLCIGGNGFGVGAPIKSSRARDVLEELLIVDVPLSLEQVTETHVVFRLRFAVSHKVNRVVVRLEGIVVVGRLLLRDDGSLPSACALSSESRVTSSESGG